MFFAREVKYSLLLLLLPLGLLGCSEQTEPDKGRYKVSMLILPP